MTNAGKQQLCKKKRSQEYEKIKIKTLHFAFRPTKIINQ
jgi:hypothetical protein